MAETVCVPPPAWEIVALYAVDVAERNPAEMLTAPGVSVALNADDVGPRRFAAIVPALETTALCSVVEAESRFAEMLAVADSVALNAWLPAERKLAETVRVAVTLALCSVAPDEMNAAETVTAPGVTVALCRVAFDERKLPLTV